MRKFQLVSLVGVALCILSSHLALADTKKELEKIADLAQTMVSNGDVSGPEKYSVGAYDVFDEQRKAIDNFLDSGGCTSGGIKPRANFESNLKLLKRVSLVGTGDNRTNVIKLVDAVKKLKTDEKLKSILSVSWDEKVEATENADGVSCSVYLVRLFTVDGYKLTIVYSHTD